MLGSLHHVELYVKNLEKTKAFYSWLLEELGYELYQSWPEGFSYRLDKTYLVFVQATKLDVAYHRCQPGINHLAFYGGSQTFVDEMVTKLKEKKVKLLYHERYPYAGGQNHYALYFEDPEGMKLEIVAE